MALSRQQKVIIFLLLVYWPSLFILEHIPIPQVVYKAQVSDKILHCLAYLVLTFLLWLAISPVQKVSWRKTKVWLVLVAVVWYGVIDELLQGFVGRSCDVLDLLANYAGMLMGLILFTFLSFWPVLLAVSAIVIFGLTNLARANLAELVPITNALFHFFAYGFFAAVWTGYMQLSLPIETLRAKWLIRALIVPIVFLLAVKLFSIIIGRHFGILDVILSVTGVTVAVTVSYIRVLFHRRYVETLPPSGA